MKFFLKNTLYFNINFPPQQTIIVKKGKKYIRRKELRFEDDINFNFASGMQNFRNILNHIKLVKIPN